MKREIKELDASIRENIAYKDKGNNSLALHFRSFSIFIFWNYYIIPRDEDQYKVISISIEIYHELQYEELEWELSARMPRKPELKKLISELTFANILSLRTLSLQRSIYTEYCQCAASSNILLHDILLARVKEIMV